MSTLPVLAPIQKLLQSRKFVLVLAYILVQFLVRAVPSLAPYTADLTAIVTFALGAMFLHLSIEDIVKLLKNSDAPTSLADAEQSALVTGGSVLIGASNGTTIMSTPTTPPTTGVG